MLFKRIKFKFINAYLSSSRMGLFRVKVRLVSTLTLTLTLKQHSLKQDRPQPWPWPRPRNLLTPSGLQVQSALTTRPRCLIYIYEASDGSRGGVRGARTPPLPLFLDQNEARRAEKIYYFF